MLRGEQGVREGEGEGRGRGGGGRSGRGLFTKMLLVKQYIFVPTSTSCIFFLIRRNYFVLFYRINWTFPLFDGQYIDHDQMDDVAMGSPLGPVLATIFTCYFVENGLMNGTFCYSFWYKYVDDTFP